MSTLLLFALHSAFIFAVGFGIGLRETFKGFFMNFSKFEGNGYFIGALVVIASYIGVIIPFPWIGRKLYGGLFCVFFIASCWYLVFLFFRQAIKSGGVGTGLSDILVIHLKDKPEVVLKLFLLIPIVSFGLLMNLLFTRKKLVTLYGLLASSALLVVWLICIRYINFGSREQELKVQTRFEEYIIYLIVSGLYSIYLHKDAKFMVTKRIQRYHKQDYIICFTDFILDFFYRFWYDLFVTEKKEGDQSPQMQSEITISMSKEKQVQDSTASNGLIRET